MKNNIDFDKFSVIIKITAGISFDTTQMAQL